MMTRCGGSLVVLTAILLLSRIAHGDDCRPPTHVTVQPVFFVSKDEQPPTEQQSVNLLRHLKWAQTRYRELLKGQDTFTLADGQPQVYGAEHDFAFYRQLPAGGAAQFVIELLKRDKCNRFNCPYIYVVVMMSPKEDYLGGGGIPINGGFNTGGGVFIMTSHGLDHSACMQSTMQHELGHAFGLPHVDVYGYDMTANASLMSYNPSHHTNGFEPSKTPGVFIAEDLRGLALNRRVFANLRYDPKTDCPAGYSIAKRPVVLGAMSLPGQPEVAVTTTSGEANGSKVACIVQGVMTIGENLPDDPATSDEAKTFDPQAMWQSSATANGWASVEVAFPSEVELTKVAIHSRHGGKYHPAEAVRIAVAGDGGFRDVVETPLASADAAVSFPQTKARTWRFFFKTDASRAVVIRGLQFFIGDDEIFPTLAPVGRG
jgi:hypothetical protein